LSVSSSRRERIEHVIELLVAALDTIDGDTDIEDGDQDRCDALDDAPISGATFHGSDRASLLPGDPDDAEDDDPPEHPSDGFANPVEDSGKRIDPSVKYWPGWNMAKTEAYHHEQDFRLRQPVLWALLRKRTA
jgi:hypothetical protein